MSLMGVRKAVILGGAVRFEPEAQALFSRFAVQPSAARKALINDVWRTPGIKSILAKLDYLHVNAAHDSQAANQNWLADAYNLTAFNSPTFTTDRGYTGDGVSAYLDTGFNLATADAGSAGYKRNSAVLGGWNLTSRAGDTTGLMGVSRTSGTFVCDLVPRFTDNNAYIRCNASVFTDKFASTESAGHFTARRSGLSAASTLKNGVEQSTSASGSSAPPSATMTILATRINGTPSSFSTDQVAVSYIGGHLTDGEVAGLHAALSTYLTEVGAL